MVVRMRHNRSQTGQSRAHQALKGRAVVVDKKTQTPHLRHRVDMKTGMYKGKSVINVVKKAEKTTAKKSKKAEK